MQNQAKVDFTQTIESQITQLNTKEEKFNSLIEELQEAFAYGIEDEEGVLHKVLDDFMWGYLKLQIVKLSGMLSLYLGSQPLDKKPDLNVLSRRYPELNRIITVQGGQSTVIKDVQQFRKDEVGIEEKKGKEQTVETEPVQLIQTQGQPLPTLYELSEGDVSDRYAFLILYLKTCQKSLNAYYKQASLGDEKSKSIALRKVEQDLMPTFLDLQGIFASAFETIRREWRQLAGSLAKAQMAMNMPYYPMERQRREIAYGYMSEEAKEADRVWTAGEEEDRKRAMASGQKAVES